MTAFTPFRAAIVAAFSLLAAAICAHSSRAATYVIDSERAGVSFTYYAGFFSESGRFTEMHGLFQFDGRLPERGAIDAVVKTASLTANAWERELKSSMFFNVTVFPEIRFKSHSLRPVGPNSVEFTGDLTMNGVTQQVTLLTVLRNGSHISASAHIKRSAFNMTALSFLISDEIDIQIEAGLIEKKTP